MDKTVFPDVRCFAATSQCRVRHHGLSYIIVVPCYSVTVPCYTITVLCMPSRAVLHYSGAVSQHHGTLLHYHGAVFIITVPYFNIMVLFSASWCLASSAPKVLAVLQPHGAVVHHCATPQHYWLCCNCCTIMVPCHGIIVPCYTIVVSCYIL